MRKLIWHTCHFIFFPFNVICNNAIKGSQSDKQLVLTQVILYVFIVMFKSVNWLNKLMKFQQHQLVSQHLLCFSSQELYERCDKLRRAAFKMATETEDNDTSLGLLVWYFLYLKKHCLGILIISLCIICDPWLLR